MKNNNLLSKQFFESTKDLKTYESFKVLYPDPATVIQIIETGKQIFSMFRKKKAKKNVEIEYLKNIYQQTIQIKQDLQYIINLLIDLKIFIVQNEINNIIRRLYSEINTVNLSIIEWLENGEEDLSAQLRSIVTLNSELQSFGFAHIHVCILAMQKQLDLCIWLKKSNNYTDTLIKQHISYFTSAITERDSPGQKLVEIQKKLDDLEKIYTTPKDYSKTYRIVLRPSTGCGTEGYHEIRESMRIDGDFLTGFQFTIRQDVTATSPPVNSQRCPGDGQGGRGGQGFNTNIDELFIFEPNQHVDFNAIKEQYLRARDEYIRMFNNKLEIKAIVDTINQTIKFLSDFKNV